MPKLWGTSFVESRILVRHRYSMVVSTVRLGSRPRVSRLSIQQCQVTQVLDGCDKLGTIFALLDAFNGCQSLFCRRSRFDTPGFGRDSSLHRIRYWLSYRCTYIDKQTTIASVEA